MGSSLGFSLFLCLSMSWPFFSLHVLVLSLHGGVWSLHDVLACHLSLHSVLVMCRELA